MCPRLSHCKRHSGASAGAFSLAGKSITPRGSRTMRPSTVARFNSVSVVASGFVKLLFNSVMTAWRSAGPNELTRSSVSGFPRAKATRARMVLPKQLACLGHYSRRSLRQRVYRQTEANEGQRRELCIGNRCRPITHFLIARKFEFRIAEFGVLSTATHSVFESHLEQCRAGSGSFRNECGRQPRMRARVRLRVLIQARSPRERDRQQS